MNHHLHTVIVSYKRRAMTERTLASYLETVSVPYSLVIVDNGSPPDVTDWLESLDVPTLFLGQNFYPGYATNRGWEQAPPETTLLQRSDNDTLYLPGWCDEMVECFDSRPEVGQYGPIAEGDEAWAAMPNWPVGGNSIVRRTLYDDGLRYTETPWPELKVIEEHQLTMDVVAMGWERAFGSTPGIVYIDDRDEAYHAESRAARGLQ